MPVDTPVTTPVPVTVAFALPALHTPPVAASVKLMVEPPHTVVGPLIVPALGAGLTVMSTEALPVPQALVTV